MLLQFKGNILITIRSAPPEIKHFLRWDWETTLARLRPRVSAGVEVTLVALPELCLLVRIRPGGMQRKIRLSTGFFHRQQQHLTCCSMLAGLLHTQLARYNRKVIQGEATPFIRLAEMQGRE